MNQTHLNRKRSIRFSAIVLAVALVLSIFAGVSATGMLSKASSDSSTPVILISHDGSSSIASKYRPMNNTYYDGEMLACFDFHIFAEKFTSSIHTHGNIAVNTLTNGTEFGVRQSFDTDSPNISYVNIPLGWSGASVADAFVFGPDVKITSSGSQVYIETPVLDENGNKTYDEDGNVVYNNAIMLGNNMGGIIYNSYNNPLYIDVTAELEKAALYSKSLVSLVGDENYTVADIAKDESSCTLDIGGEYGDTVIVNLTAEELLTFINYPFAINNTTGKRIIFNVDMRGVGDSFNIGNTSISIDGYSNSESVCEVDCNVLWNFHNGTDDTYTGTLYQDGVWMGTILAPDANLHVAAVNGSMIANEVETFSETHKWDYTGSTTVLSAIDISIYKYWLDKETEDVEHPDITVNLLQNGEVYETYTFTAEEYDAVDSTFWEHEFTDLPVTDENGDTYQYEIEIADISSTSSEYTYTVVGYDIVVQFADNEEVELKVIKNWVGQTSSETLTFDVYQNDELLTTVQRQLQNNGESFTVNIQNEKLYKYSSTGKLNEYEIRETAINGYASDVVVTSTSSGNKTQYVYTFTNTKLDESKGSISIHKSVTDVNGTAMNVTDTFYISLFDSDNNLIATNTVTFAGQNSATTSFHNLAPGTYYVCETQADGSALPDSFGYESVVANNGEVTVTANGVAETNIVNISKTSEVTANFAVPKYDATNNSILANVYFGLYNAETGELIQTLHSKENTGLISCSGLGVGTYYIKELMAPIGYVGSSTQYYFEVTASDSDATINEVHTGSMSGDTITGIPNTRETGTIVLHKTNADGTVNLAGAVFDLYLDNEPFVRGLETNENGLITATDLPWGEYYFVETKAPDGYILNPSPTSSLTIDAETLTGNITVQNEKHTPVASLRIHKVDAVDSKPLHGAVYGLYTADGTMVTELSPSDMNGMISCSDIPCGTYYLKELLAPAGYSVDTEKYWFIVDESVDGETVSELHAITIDGSSVFALSNERILGLFSMKSVFSDGTVVSGTDFEIYESDSATPIGTYSTCEDGTAYVSDLEWGEYTVKVISVPDGYTVETPIYTFEVSADTLDHKHTVTCSLLTDDVITSDSDIVSDTDSPVTPSDSDIPSPSISDTDVSATDTPSDDSDSGKETNPSCVVTIQCSDGSVNPGDTVYYIITVTNTGDVPLHDLTISDTLTGLDELIDSIPTSGEWTITLLYTVPSDASGNIHNTVTVISEDAFDYDSCSFQVLGASDTDFGSDDSDSYSDDEYTSGKDYSDEYDNGKGNSVDTGDDSTGRSVAITVLVTSIAVIAYIVFIKIRRNKPSAKSR